MTELGWRQRGLTQHSLFLVILLETVKLGDARLKVDLVEADVSRLGLELPEHEGDDKERNAKVARKELLRVPPALPSAENL